MDDTIINYPMNNRRMWQIIAKHFPHPGFVLNRRKAKEDVARYFGATPEFDWLGEDSLIHLGDATTIYYEGTTSESVLFDSTVGKINPTRLPRLFYELLAKNHEIINYAIGDGVAIPIAYSFSNARNVADLHIYADADVPFEAPLQ